jgi:hypothetical protein
VTTSDHTSADAPAYLYRFRSANALLGSFAELENQHIYFASPSQLNDPMEGFGNIVWSGDAIAWRNFLKHYLLNMLMTLSAVAVGGETFDISYCSNLVHMTDEELPKAPIREIYASACDRFLAHRTIQRLITVLGRPATVVRRHELEFYLRAIHPFALMTLNALAFPKGAGADQAASEHIEQACEKQLLALKSALGSRPKNDEASKVLFEVAALHSMQIQLLNEFANPADEKLRGWIHLTRDFNDYYISSLDKLVHRQWYAACFVADPTNASMWGSYGDSHRGMCLKFTPSKHENGRLYLNLHRATGLSGGRDREMETIYGYSPLYFEKVQYGNDYPEVNFFETLGTPSMQKLSRFWYAGPDGTRSTAATQIMADSDEWRAGYWKRYSRIYSTKTPDWAHEAEHRLVLHSDIVQDRRLKYRFSDLAGICFGVNTSVEDKLHAMQIIEAKCVAEGRADFEFSQAVYSTRTRKMEVEPLRLLKVSP